MHRQSCLPSGLTVAAPDAFGRIPGVVFGMLTSRYTAMGVIKMDNKSVFRFDIPSDRRHAQSKLQALKNIAVSFILYSLKRHSNTDPSRNTFLKALRDKQKFLTP